MVRRFDVSHVHVCTSTTYIAAVYTSHSFILVRSFASRCFNMCSQCFESYFVGAFYNLKGKNEVRIQITKILLRNNCVILAYAIFFFFLQCLMKVLILLSSEHTHFYISVKLKVSTIWLISCILIICYVQSSVVTECCKKL